MAICTRGNGRGAGAVNVALDEHDTRPADALALLHAQGAVSDLDLHFARFIERLTASAAPELALAAALASHATAQGDICVNLGQWARRWAALHPSFAPPATGAWLDTLRSSSVVGTPGQRQPLILDRRGRLYLYRYWQYEQRLAEDLRRRSRAPLAPVQPERLRSDLAALFPRHTHLRGTDWQKVAAAVAALKRVCIISGGPGTGKTSTVLKVLALLIGQAQRPLRIALAAPTGKAAARMQESIRAAKPSLGLSAAHAAQIPETASTLHRLLGSRPDSVYFHHNAERPLLLDVLVIDEVSMVGLALMAKTVDALLPQTRLILLGDKDQLASVDAGAILGDLCAGAGQFSADFQQQLSMLTGEQITKNPAANSAVLSDNIVLLKHSYRFDARSGIGALATAVNRGRAQQAMQLFAQHADINWQEVENAVQLAQRLAEPLCAGFAPYLEAVHNGESPTQIFAQFNRFRLLAALRKGAFGVVELNQLCEKLLAERGLIDCQQVWYAGRPIMVTRNDYNLRLFNGDIGIALPATDATGMQVCFIGNDGAVRSFPAARLPEHETVYAMTVHKSQGSEFERILVVIPDQDSPVLSRELLYTALTRAKQEAWFYGSEAVFLSAVAKRLRRSSGLRDHLWRRRDIKPTALTTATAPSEQ